VRCGPKLGAAEKLDAGGKPDAAVLRNGVKLDAAKRRLLRTAGAAIAALASGLHPFRFSSGLRASRSYGQRFCDLATSKHTAAMAAVISGAKVSSAQCLQGFAARTWRENDHGRPTRMDVWRATCSWPEGPEAGGD